MLERFGGVGGVRDLGLVESALFRPQTGHYQTLCEQAAALLQSLARNHPFVDESKRVAFALTAIFLRINGNKLVVTADEGERFLIEQVIRNRVELGEISAWLEAHVISDE